MSADSDHDLSPDQWEVLKMLRLPASRRRAVNRFAVDRLIALQLAMLIDEQPVMTPQGRKALVRGSSRLWDVAA
jgi:hypothetical protein